MPSPAFCNLISKEQHRIRTRCEEIDGTTQALEEERRALVERDQALEAIRDLYETSQQTVDEALEVQVRLNASVANGPLEPEEVSA